jgi:DNA invertase Pin-like site-specific DNA recombinase
MVKAYSYIRFSSKKQMDGDSLRRQTERAEKYVASHPELDLELDNNLSFQDLGVSGFRGANITDGGLSEFLEAVRSGLVEAGSYLIVENLDRVSRLPFKKAARVLEDICELDINVVTLSDGTIYTKDSDLADYIRAALEFERAHKESARKSELSNANWKQLRKQAVSSGRVMSNNTVSWLNVEGEKDNRHFVVNEDKASIVRIIVDLFLSGQGCQAIATKLNVDDVPTLRDGKLWQPRSVHSILSNPAICGRYVMGEKARQAKEAPIDGYYPALISIEKYNEINLMLNRGNVKQRDEIANPIAGICYCSVCGSKMTRFKTQSHGERLICSAAKVKKCDGGYKTIKLSTVWEAVKALVTIQTKWSGDDENAAMLAELQRQKSELQGKIDRTIKAIQLHGHSTALGSSLKALEAEKASLDAEIDRLASERLYAAPDRMIARLDEVRELIDAKGGLQAVNGLLRRLFDRITIDVERKSLKAKWIGTDVDWEGSFEGIKGVAELPDMQVVTSLAS